MQLNAYLERIHYGGDIAPTRQVLAKLLSQHVQHIPFENLDVQLGRSSDTSPDAAYDKIVNRSRGGWCYEQNGLFGWVLSEIGFRTTRVAAAVMRASRGDIANANHLCLLVQPDDAHEEMLVDVGFGGSMIAPVPLRQSEFTQSPFRMGLRHTEDGQWQFWEDAGDGEFSFDFNAEPADEAALQAKCEFLQTDPSSGFVQSLVAQIRRPDAHETLRGRVLSHNTKDGIETHILNSADELVATLRDVFNLDVPDVARLWPRIQERHAEWEREQAVSNTYEIRSRSNSGDADE